MHKFDDIVPPSRRKDTDSLKSSTDRPTLNLSERPPKFPYSTLIIVAIVILVSVGVLFYFSSAKVEVTPHTVSAAVQGSFTATQTAGTLPYEIITAQKVASQSVKGSGTKAVSSSASGTLTIYNTQSKAQKLITNTRFATGTGLIFRIHAAVSVPGGSATKPGNITATVYADKAGDTYNVGPTSFTIPGFAGTPQATAVYARSSAPMTGGASGNVPVVDVAAGAEARTALMKALATDLATSIEAQVPAGYVLLPGASVTTYEELTPVPSSTTGMVDIKEQGTITAVVFPNLSLAKAVASSIGGLGYQGEPVTLSSVKGLTLSAPSGMPEVNAPSFTFTLSGTASLIYTVDPTRIAAAVSGKTRSAAEVALTNYPEVKRAVIVLRPFWQKTFPQDPSSISVTVLNQ
ncbi:hypothetical protein EXS57_02255 [Candidatus Kaiserbacteria bacterium]|nr:hypothetical protein [Candidatus Kaiserbacteria bacterium]